MSTTSNFGKPWTVFGRFLDFEAADFARKTQAPAGFQAKVHKQEHGFVVKIRESPKDEGDETVAAEPKKAKKEKKAK